ncbi:MAG: hypothetical protein ACRC92_22005 [Peptostreptococcaceae bacterium]
MSKKFKMFAMTCLISVASIGMIGGNSFASEIQGTERVTYPREGEISITPYSSEPRSAYSSTLSMDNQLVEGKSRSYTAGQHRITLKVVDKGSPNSGMPNKCKITLQKSKLGGGTNLSSKTLDLHNIGSTYSATFTNQSAGSYRYVFDNRASTIGNWDYIDWFKCNPVNMYS